MEYSKSSGIELLGPRIKEWRQDRNLSQQQLAEKIGVKSNSVSRYESGVARPSIDVLIALADFFGVSTDYLLGRTEF